MAEEAGSLPRPAQGEAARATGSVPAAHARSDVGTAAEAMAPKPSRDPLARIRWASLPRGPFLDAHRLDIKGRDAVRGASVDSRRGPLGPPRGKVSAAELDGEGAGVAPVPQRCQRLGAWAGHMVKEPSAVRMCIALLKFPRSYNSSHSVHSGSSGRCDRTIEVVIAA